MNQINQTPTNLIKLNGSSFDLETPMISNQSNKEYVQFEQCSFNHQIKQPLKLFHRPNLTLHLDQSNHQSSNTIKSIQPQQPITILNQISAMQSHIQYLQSYNQKLLDQCQKNKQLLEQNKKDMYKMTLTIRKKDQSIQLYKEKIDLLQKKIIEIEKDNLKNNQLKANKEQPSKDIYRKYQKVIHINKQLQKEIRDAEKKLVDMERQMHKNVCHNLHENVVRLKESSIKIRQISATNKENQTIPNSNNQRKSLECKKNTSTLQKGQKNNSSNINILAKKLGHNAK